MRLSEIPRELLRVECLRCFRCVEIQRLDAVKLYGPHATWREVGNRLLDHLFRSGRDGTKRTDAGRISADNLRHGGVRLDDLRPALRI
jgi:hypothetical protein